MLRTLAGLTHQRTYNSGEEILRIRLMQEADTDAVAEVWHSAGISERFRLGSRQKF
jgi:hypothetical protein